MLWLTVTVCLTSLWEYQVPNGYKVNHTPTTHTHTHTHRRMREENEKVEEKCICPRVKHYDK